MTVRTSISLAVAIGGTTLLSPHAVIAQRPDSAIAGVWNLAERGAQVAMHLDAEAGWTGTILHATRPADVGKPLFRGLRFDPRHSVWRGSILRPEDGSAASVTVRAASGDTLIAVARKAFFSRTLVFTRVATAP
jgi:hypothetical protein